MKRINKEKTRVEWKERKKERKKEKRGTVRRQITVSVGESRP
jgi:hypothetical protein